jgi:predicted DNA-binding WGR domain protein
MQTYLEKRQPAQKMARFYRMAVMPNLFGEWTLYREWGRIGQGYWVEPQQLAMFR